MVNFAPLPTGTVTFLFTDIEGSTRLWEQHPEAMRLALARHQALAAAIIDQHGGTLVKQRGEGDSLFVVFARATDALSAACALQRAFGEEVWPAVAPLRIRMALHTGEAEVRENDYFGAAVNRCARVRAAAHGGQVLLSQATMDLVQDDLPSGVSLRDLGAHRLRDLQRPERIFQLLHSDLPAGFPPLQTLDVLPNNLPLQVTSFVGREKEMEDVKQLLSMTRLLTLTGTGGTGKTRLALQVTADLLQEYSDGVWLVELAPLSDPALVPQTVAAVLGVREEPGRSIAQTLVDALKPKRLLLILDNCEHLLAPCAQLADALLRSCPEVRILATSREGLNISGEQTHRIPSLSLPEPGSLPPTPERLIDYEAVRLFVDRALLARSSFAVTEQNAPAIAQVCHRLDGIPLAIELAAARIKALPVEHLAARLDDRFRLLTGGSRTALPRQQTLRALIDWSHDLLAEPERALLRRLSVFAGGWTLEGAEAVCSDAVVEESKVLDLLTSLVEKSLVLYEERGSEGRYRLLETVRQYARDRLLESAEVELVRARHRDFFLQFVELASTAAVSRRGAVGDGTVSGQETEWLDRLEMEHDNLLAALEWSQAGESDIALRFAAAMSWFWWIREYWYEARGWMERTLARASRAAPTPWLAQVLCEAGRYAYLQDDHTPARARLEESLAVCRVPEDTAVAIRALMYLSNVTRAQGDYAQARAFLEEAITLCRVIHDKTALCRLVGELAWLARCRGDLGTARCLLKESLALAREMQNDGAAGFTLLRLAEVAEDEGDWEAARDHYQESLALLRKTKSKGTLGWALLWLGQFTYRRGDIQAAGPLLAEGLTMMSELGRKQGVAVGLEGLAGHATLQGHAKRGARLFGAAEALYQAIGYAAPTHERAKCEREAAVGRRILGEEDFATAWAEGRAMTYEQAVDYALKEAGDDPPRE